MLGEKIREKCGTCKGTGEVPDSYVKCSECGGSCETGSYRKEEPCNSCGGSGNRVLTTKTCPDCKGNGYVDADAINCPKCASKRRCFVHQP